MVSQGIFIGVAIGVFFAGLGIGYVALQSSTTPTSPMMMNSQQMQQMMNNPQQMNQWMNTMMNDPQVMQQMHDMMMSNPQHMNQMMGPMMDTMMNDPEMQQQMMNHMMNNQGMMNSMMNNQDMMMGSGMMMNGNMMNQQTQKQNEDKQTETMSSSYVQMIDGVQVVTVNAKEFKFLPSEIHLNPGMTKFILVNNGVGEHEFVVYEASKQDILEKAELAEDEETIEENILFEIEEIHAGETGESEVMDLNKGSYVIGCLLPGHFDAGMKGTLDIE